MLSFCLMQTTVNQSGHRRLALRLGRTIWSLGGGTLSACGMRGKDRRRELSPQLLCA
jgi:hypothetical protein